eukprot:4694064-Prymnesium_polylepis.1
MPVRLLRTVVDTARYTHTHARTHTASPTPDAARGTYTHTHTRRSTDGLWPMVRKAVLERYAALRCLWHG